MELARIPIRSRYGLRWPLCRHPEHRLSLCTLYELNRPSSSAATDQPEVKTLAMGHDRVTMRFPSRLLMKIAAAMSHFKILNAGLSR